MTKLCRRVKFRVSNPGRQATESSHIVRRFDSSLTWGRALKLWIVALAGTFVAACSQPVEFERSASTSPAVDPSLELARVPASLHGDGFALRVAPPTGDAIEVWGLCLARVADCYTPGSSPFEREACLRRTDSAPTFGENRCSSACRANFEVELAHLHDVEAAVDASYKHGRCVEGFKRMSEGALEHLKLNPRALDGVQGGAQ